MQKGDAVKSRILGSPYRWGTAAAVVLALCGLTVPASAADLTGKVQLVKPDGKAAKDKIRVLVYYTPDDGAPALQPPAEPFELFMARKQFQPSSLIVPMGSTVRFPNDDTILHNVFSASGRNRFDLGLYRQGTGKEATFRFPGVVRVFCNVHHSMVAHIVVVNTPYYTVTDSDGNFRLSDVPEGEGTLTLWYERSDPTKLDVSVPLTGAITADLVVSKAKVPQHRNKFNKPYKRRRRGKAYN